MANSKIEDLTELTVPVGTDLSVVVDDPSGTPITKKITIDNLTQLVDVRGTQTIWADSAAWIVPPTTTPCEFTSREASTNKTPIVALSFDTSSSEVAWLKWTPPPNWNAGTIRFKLYWTNASGLTTETIDFDLAGVAFDDDDSLDTAVGTPQNITDTWIAQNDLHISAYSSDITIAGSPAAGELLYLKLSRDVAADDLTGDAEVLGIEIEYTLSSATAT